MIRTGPNLRALTLGLAAVLVVACTEPEPPESTRPPEGAEDVMTAEALDPARDELLETLRALATTVAAAQAELDTAAASENPARARRAAATALALLLDDPEALSTTELALFPSHTAERAASADADDLLSIALTAARDAGGPLGRATVEVLREPVAGDLGAWERDAAGVVASASGVVEDARDVDAVADEVLALPADGLRALAWTMLATETRDAETTRAAAARGSSHLAVVLIGLDLLHERAGTDDPAVVGEAIDIDSGEDA